MKGRDVASIVEIKDNAKKPKVLTYLNAGGRTDVVFPLLRHMYSISPATIIGRWWLRDAIALPP
jgi:hypothetical protein